ncbi:hypothetical protein AG4045_030787 [Apium graveolens]|uniref:Uncharacterized protein n=1 Tax=Apium graveolens TaxID=4045 RepID=A0A6L5B8T7_APIGR|nr:hypothetical protein AG4045_030787 [Apium graveolens]
MYAVVYFDRHSWLLSLPHSKSNCDFKQLNVLELFLDCIMKPSEKLIQFDVGGICNSCGGKLPTSPGHYAIAALYYLCDESNQDDVLKPKVVNIVKRYAASSSVRVSFSNLAQAFLDKHVP